ncbi:hypothetical protein [Brevundimonas sp. R86498]|uniref:hypothetical protein n=1 Tax=Brevundimonas sp. R86498 TaxID=3093845 RepID=UPI0037C73A67
MNQNDVAEVTREPAQLLSAEHILSVADARVALASTEPSSQITYLLWDTQAGRNWLPGDHPRNVPGGWAARPLYLGKSAGVSRLRSHLAKDGFGLGSTKITAHAWKNPGLLSYCLGKAQVGWLGVTYINHGVGPDADCQSEALESAAVHAVGWRCDLVRLRSPNRFAHVEGLTATYNSIHAAPVPINEGLLLNQTCPKPDGRTARFN